MAEILTRRAFHKTVLGAGASEAPRLDNLWSYPAGLLRLLLLILLPGVVLVFATKQPGTSMVAEAKVLAAFIGVLVVARLALEMVLR